MPKLNPITSSNNAEREQENRTYTYIVNLSSCTYDACVRCGKLYAIINIEGTHALNPPGNTRRTRPKITWGSTFDGQRGTRKWHEIENKTKVNLKDTIIELQYSPVEENGERRTKNSEHGQNVKIEWALTSISRQKLLKFTFPSAIWWCDYKKYY